MSAPNITVTLRVRGAGADDYGVARLEVSVTEIDWSLADAPREQLALADIYEVVLAVGLPNESPETDTWDRA